MLEKVEVLCHSSIRITGSKTIYIDPFRIKENYNDADYVFCTHSHYDHFSKEDIVKLLKPKTVIITIKDAKEEAEELVGEEGVIIVEPAKEYKVNDLNFKTTYSYNLNKHFHPKENDWVGFIIELDGIEYYIAGDTDNVTEIQNIKCDVALLPIGGTYTMTVEEAAELATSLDSKYVIPTHYGEIVGEKTDGEKFAKLVINKEVVLKIK